MQKRGRKNTQYLMKPMKKKLDQTFNHSYQPHIVKHNKQL